LGANKTEEDKNFMPLVLDNQGITLFVQLKNN